MPVNENVLFRPARNVLGALRLPGDKSISHRYAMLAGIAPGVTRLADFSTGADCASTLGCLGQLGCGIRRGGNGSEASGGVLEIEGGESLAPPAESLDCGNSGSSMRMMAGILAWHDFSCALPGEASASPPPLGGVVPPRRQS